MRLGWHNQDVTLRRNDGPRVMALDVGKKRIGLAMTDGTGLGVTGLDTLHRKTLREDVERLSRTASERKVERVIVGLPLHMNGEESVMAKQARLVADKLRLMSGLPVEMHDERLTSVEAEAMLQQRGWSLKKLLEEKKKGAVDRLAAMILLEDWLSAQAAAGEDNA